MSETMAAWLAVARRVARRPLPHMADPATRLLVRFFLILCGRLIEVDRPDRLAAAPEPTIFVLNHNNSSEAILAPAALIYHRAGRNIRFLVDWMFVELPVSGWVIGKIDPIPVFTKPARWRLKERYRLSQQHRSPIKEAMAGLLEGRSIGIFPEGTRNRDPHTLRRGRVGVGRLVLLSEAPVLPVGIRFPDGSRRGRIPALGRMQLIVGEPLRFEQERRQARERLSGVPDGVDEVRAERELSRRVVDRVMVQLAELSGKRYPYSTAESPNSTAEPPSAATGRRETLE